MIKKILFLALLIATITKSSFAQEKDGFDINRMFAGGTLVVGLGFGNNSQFTVGGNPEIGYSIFKNVDLGLCGNYIYTKTTYPETQITTDINGNSYEYNTGRYIKQTSTLYGLGVFARIHFNERYFIQVQPEFNNISHYGEIVDNPNENVSGNLKSSSFLVGFGYGSRDIGNMNFFTTILIDLQKDLYSPYRDGNGNIIPIVRGGVNFYFGRGKKKK